MAILDIRLFPDPVLRVACPSVAHFDADLRRLADDMVETMHAAPGVGLAAPQVGIATRLAVVDVSVSKDPERLMFLVNPEIVESSGEEFDFEGCLSIPQLTEKVRRPTWLRLRAQDLAGEFIEYEAEDFEARAICHEIDHLDGVLFIDHLRGLRRDKMRRKLRKLELV